MTVADLREKLKQFPDTMEVVMRIPNEEGDYHSRNPYFVVDDADWLYPQMHKVLVIQEAPPLEEQNSAS